MATIASAFVQLMPSFQGGQREIERQMGGSLDSAGRSGGRRFGGAMSGAIGGLATKMFAPLAAAAASVSVVGFFKDSIGQASDLNEAGTKLAAIFGTEGTAAVQKFADAGAKSLGQNRLAVLDASATFGTFGKAAGLAGTDLADFSTGFAGLSTDLASFYNTSPEEAVEAIGAALRGEAEPIRKYGVLMDDASLRQEALAQGLIKTTKEALTPQQKVLAAQGLIMKQTADAQGDFERTSGGLANQQRILSATVTDLKGKIGSALLPVVTRITTAVAGFVSGMLDGTGAGGKFRAFLEGVLNAVKPIGTFLTGTVVPAVKAFFGALKSDATDPSSGIGKVGAFITGTLVPAFQTFIGFVKTNVIPTVQRMGDFFITRIVPVLQQVGQFLITTVVPALISMAQTIASKVGPILQALWSQFQTNVLPALKQVFNVIATKVVPVLIRIGQVLVPVIKFIVKLVANVLGFLIPVLIKFAGPIVGFVIKAIGAVIGWLAKFIGWILDVGGKVRAFVLAAVAKFMDFKGRVIFAFNALMAAARSIFEQIKAWIIAKIVQVVAVAQQVVAFKDRVVAAFAAMRNNAVAWVSSLVSDVRALPGRILAAVGNLAYTLRQKGRDLIQGLINGISEKIQSIRNKMSEVAGAIGNFLPGSPVKEGPLKKWNRGMAGKRLVGMLADGLSDTTRVDEAMRGLTSSIATPRIAGSVGVTGGGAGGDVAAALRGMTWSVKFDRRGIATLVMDEAGALAESGTW